MNKALHGMPDSIFKFLFIAGLFLFVWQRPVLFDAGAVGIAPAAISAPTVPVAPPPDTATAPQAPTVAPQSRMAGIDASHYQGKIDWVRVKSQHIAFAYLKATEGKHYVDPRYERNRSGATASGLRVGSYHFFLPEEDAIHQADHFLSRAHIGAGSLPPALDLERIPHGHARGTYVKHVQSWLRHVEAKAGCKPVIYADRSFWNGYLGKALADYPLWLAEYARRPTLPKGANDWVFWQHSSRGQLSGISGFVDLNWFHADGKAMDALLCRGRS